MAGRIALALLFGAILLLGGLDAVAEDQAEQQQTAREAEPVFGRDLMTDDEVAAHRAKMRSLQTEEERSAYRAEHHEKMVERAKERGVTLPEQPPAAGKGRGQGPGMGKGRGQGQGMGRGPRRGDRPQQPRGPGGGPGS